MNVGLVGLGRMGLAIAMRLMQAGHTVYGFEISSSMRERAHNAGVLLVDTVQQLSNYARVIWLMIPPGKPVDDTLAQLHGVMSPEDIIIDGGNSFFGDSVRRAEKCISDGVFFLDCGTSGGVHGLERGFCLMVGGERLAFVRVEPIFQALSASQGYAHVGPSGAGHYVKMVHNGIEYALMQAYAEGFHVLHDGSYASKLNLEQIARLWNHGAVIQSFLLELIGTILERDQSLKDILGLVEETGMGVWTQNESQKHEIPTPALKQALNVREWSRKTGGNYATKLIALLRQQFGGHSVTHKSET